jgi:predicted peroxiredoxin
MAVDDKVVIGLTHGLDDPESVLIAYLLGVEALRKDKQVVMWLTKDGVHVATPGLAAQVEVPGAPSVPELHKEYVERGGRFFACPVCVWGAITQSRRELRPDPPDCA